MHRERMKLAVRLSITDTSWLTRPARIWRWIAAVIDYAGRILAAQA
jgi:hypothetical protein